MNSAQDIPSAPVVPVRTPRIKVVGVGGAGLQAVTHMAQSSLPGVSFAAVHTAARLLAPCPLQDKILLGADRTRGLGAGGDPAVAHAVAEEDLARCQTLWAGSDLVILVAGLGGGTGSGAAPVLARAARETGSLVLGLVTLPFEFEGLRRLRQAEEALRHLKTAADAVLCLSNQKVLSLLDEQTTLVDAFRITNEMLADGLRGLWRLVTREGLINADFASLCRTVRGRQAVSSFATAEATGDNRSREVLDRLLANPLLDNGQLLADAEAVLVSLAGGTDLTLKEVHAIMTPIHRLCEHAQVIVGASVDPVFGDRLALTVVATRRTPINPVPSETDPATTADAVLPTAEFPPAPRVLSPAETEAPAEYHPSRYVPPPPNLTPEQTEHLLEQQGGSVGRRRRKHGGMRQGLLPLEVVSKARFAKSEPTLYRGEDLDTPTYVRRGVALN